MRIFVSGGAPLGIDTARWFASVGVAVWEGYGLTETSPVIALNTGAKQRIGSVGQPLAKVEVQPDVEGEREHHPHRGPDPRFPERHRVLFAVEDAQVQEEQQPHEHREGAVQPPVIGEGEQRGLGHERRRAGLRRRPKGTRAGATAPRRR